MKRALLIIAFLFALISSLYVIVFYFFHPSYLGLSKVQLVMQHPLEAVVVPLVGYGLAFIFGILGETYDEK